MVTNMTMWACRGPMRLLLQDLWMCSSVQIVRQDRTMEEIVFPVPNICEFLTLESKLRVYYTTERDEQGSKINDFFLSAEDLFNEMNWQKKLRGRVSGWHVHVRVHITNIPERHVRYYRATYAKNDISLFRTEV